ncbi:GGDEF domain-containing protein [Chloroflexi bacterium CFX6]|nr:GGDEF domain-containing protein [Chloroflexi bacterium CFX6]
MDNELKIFLQSFKELENLFQALPITEDQFQRLKGVLADIQRNAKHLALYDAITHALNSRAGKWLVPADQVKGMAKVDIYDLRQANKVYGVPVVDAELHKLAYQFMSIFTLDKGDFVRRSPGSDEFRIFSTSKTPREIKRLLSKLYKNQETDSLLTWDFGVGLTETEAESELQKQRKTFRPLVLRQTILESHSEIPKRVEEGNSYQNWNEFNIPYERLMDTIRSLALPSTLELQTLEQVRITRDIVESIVTRDALTGALNGLGAKWYLENATIQAMALTDMLNMHEGNNRFGSAAIDQDLKRFSNLLLRHFPKDEGFLLFRSERAGDEFKIASFRKEVAELEDRIRSVWSGDLHRGLLGWNYGVGRNDAEAHVNLYRNRLNEMESKEMSVLNGKSTFIIVRPESEDYPDLYRLSEDTAHAVGGAPIVDLHMTLQSIRNVEDFDALRQCLEEYSRKLRPFEIKVRNIARMNVNNQQGRLWLLAERSVMLETLYNELSEIALRLGGESYPYKPQNWLPHIKIVELPEDGSTRIKDPTFGHLQEITFTVRRLEWTVQKEPEHWELLDQFPLSE